MCIKFENNIPIHIQIINHIKILIITGIYKPGEKIPSVRDLALEYKVNPNTIQKSLSELENIKLIYTESTNGKYVTDNKSIINKYKNEYIKTLTNNYINKMKELNLNKDDINEILGGIKWN